MWNYNYGRKTKKEDRDKIPPDIIFKAVKAKNIKNNLSTQQTEMD